MAVISFGINTFSPFRTANHLGWLWCPTDGSNAWGSTFRARINALYPSTPAPPPAPAPAGGYPFGSRKNLVNGKYPNGIMPTNFTAAQMDARLTADYDQWAANRLVHAPTFTPTSGILKGQTITTGYYCSNGNGTAPGGCYSEGQGYAMLLTVVYAGYDANAKVRFDGLYQVWRGKPAYGMPSSTGADIYTMDWTLDTNLNSLSGGGYNANDGDQDAALACLMADVQWGSTGAINYKQQAINTINAMKAANFSASGEPKAPQNTSRTSDYMIATFVAYKKATGDTFWDTAIARCKSLVQTVISGYSASAGLLPGCIYDPDGPNPRPDNVTDFDHNGGLVQYYDQNANRDPWRFGMAWILGVAEAFWGTTAAKMNATIKGDSGSSDLNVGYQYSLAGACMTSRYFEPATNGPIMVGAMCDPTMQSWLNTLFADNTALPVTGNSAASFKTTYYGSELQLMCATFAAGNWWMP